LIGVPSEERSPAVMTLGLKPLPMPGFQRTEIRGAVPRRPRPRAERMTAICSTASMLRTMPGRARTLRKSASLPLVPV